MGEYLMPINTGYIEGSFQAPGAPAGQLAWYRVYYNENATPVGDTQPIVNKNLNGTNCAFESWNPGSPFKVMVWRPELGPVDDENNWERVRCPGGWVRFTAQQLAQWGITQRGHVAVRSIGDSDT